MVAYQLGLLFEPHFDRPVSRLSASVWALASWPVAVACTLNQHPNALVYSAQNVECALATRN